MAEFRPFQALRFRLGPARPGLQDLLAPPYDVLSDADVAALRARDPHNIVHLDVPAPDTAYKDRYAAAAAHLRTWRDEGVLVRDDVPSFTIYRMSFVDDVGRARQLVGVLGALEVVDEGAGGVLPHERTTPKASTDRLDLTRATRTNLSPVWGLSLASGLTGALAEAGEPIGEVTVEGVRHVVERVTDPARMARISAIVGADDVLIADGHHEYGIARRLRDEIAMRAAPAGGVDGPGPDGQLDEWAGVGATLTFVGELVADQLSIEAIHRLVSGVSRDQLRELLGRDFVLDAGPRLAGSAGDVSSGDASGAEVSAGEVSGDASGVEASGVEESGVEAAEVLAAMAARGRLALLDRDGQLTWLTPRPGAFDGVRALDGAWLEHTFAGSPVTLDYQHGVPETLVALRQGLASAAILIRPTSLAEIERTAREGLLMPPKSTFFTPKLRTGFVLRPLDGR